MNPVIKFTTLFGLLAVELAVKLSAEQGPCLSHGAGGGFLRAFDGLRLAVVLRDADRVGAGLSGRLIRAAPAPDTASSHLRDSGV